MVNLPTIPTIKEWECKQLLYKEVADSIASHLASRHIPFMPINGAYFCHTNQLHQIPPGRLFELHFCIPQGDFGSAIDSFDAVPKCIKVLDTAGKSVFSYSLDSFEIKVDLYKALSCPGNTTLESGRLFSRGRPDGTTSAVLPAPEDVVLILFCTYFHFSVLFSDEAIFTISALLFSDPSFSWDRFWQYARDYHLEKFAAFLLMRYSRHTKGSIKLMKRSLYAVLSATPLMQYVYRISPQLLRKLLFKVPFVPHPLRYMMHKLLGAVAEQSICRIKRVYTSFLKLIAKQVIIDAENVSLQHFSQSLLEDAKCYSIKNTCNELLIISTTTGLWILRNNAVHQIAVGACYGVTRMGNRWYCSQRVGNHSRIVSFRINLAGAVPRMTDVVIEHTGLSLNVHQIDSFADELFFVDTLKNRIGYVTGNGKRKWIYPNRKMRSNVPAQDNNHFNSLYITDDYIYVLAHNGWLKPKRNSQVYVLRKSDFMNHTILETDTQEAHNIILYKDSMFFCDSRNGKLIRDDTAIFTDTDHFLRGLAVTDEFIVIGGSQIIERSKRRFSDSVIWFCDHNGSVKQSVELAKIGQVHEIRGFERDYGLSQLWKSGR